MQTPMEAIPCMNCSRMDLVTLVISRAILWWNCGSRTHERKPRIYALKPIALRLEDCRDDDLNFYCFGYMQRTVRAGWLVTGGVKQLVTICIRPQVANRDQMRTRPH